MNKHEIPSPPPLSWRNVPHYLLLGFLWLLCHLPRGLAFGLGAWLARCLFTLLPYRKRIVLKNLAYAFPELSEAERKALCREHINNVGYGFIEMGMAWFFSAERLRHMVRFEIDAAAQSALGDGQAVIFLGSHSTLLELGVRLLGLEIPATGMFRPQKSAFFDAWIRYQRLRASGGIPLLHFKDLRKTLSALAERQKIWYAIDQDMGHEASVFVPFFGLPTATVAIMPKLLKHHQAHLLPIYFWREADGGYVVKINAPLNALPHQPNAAEVGKSQSALPTAEALMSAVNQDLEREIRAHPAQYFWLHRRFKSDPNGGRRVY